MARSQTRVSIRVSKATAERWHALSKKLKQQEGWTGDETLNILIDYYEDRHKHEQDIVGESVIKKAVPLNHAEKLKMNITEEQIKMVQEMVKESEPSQPVKYFGLLD